MQRTCCPSEGTTPALAALGPAHLVADLELPHLERHHEERRHGDRADRHLAVVACTNEAVWPLAAATKEAEQASVTAIQQGLASGVRVDLLGPTELEALRCKKVSDREEADHAQYPAKSSRRETNAGSALRARSGGTHLNMLSGRHDCKERCQSRCIRLRF